MCAGPRSRKDKRELVTLEMIHMRDMLDDIDASAGPSEYFLALSFLKSDEFSAIF
jgi:hypothetical protein